MNQNKLIDNKKIKKIFIFLFPIISTICFLLYWTLEVRILSIIGLLTFIIPIIIFDINKSIRIYFFILPNISLFKLSKESMSLASILILIIFLKIVLNKKFKCNLLFLVGLIFYFVFSIVTYYLADNNLSLISQEIRVIINMIVIVSIIYEFGNELETLYEYLSQAFIYGCIVTCLSASIFVIIKGNEFTIFRLKAINSDPNYFSLVLALAISIILLNVYKRKYSIKDCILIIFFIVCGLLSQSRGFLVAMLFNTVIFIYIFIFTNKLSLLKKILFALVCMIFISLFYDFLLGLVKQFSERLTSEETAGGSGRIEIWNLYIQAMLSNIKNIFWGVGYNTLNYGSYLNGVAQHNLYLEIITGRGINGTIIISYIYIFLFILIKRLNSIKRIRSISWLPCLTVASGFMFLNGLTSDIGIMTFVLAFITTINFNKTY